MAFFLCLPSQLTSFSKILSAPGNSAAHHSKPSLCQDGEVGMKNQADFVCSWFTFARRHLISERCEKGTR